MTDRKWQILLPLLDVTEQNDTTSYSGPGIDNRAIILDTTVIDTTTLISDSTIVDDITIISDAVVINDTAMTSDIVQNDTSTL